MADTKTREQILHNNLILGQDTYLAGQEDNILAAMSEYSSHQNKELLERVKELEEEREKRNNYENHLEANWTCQKSVSRIKELEEAIQEFVDRVDRKEVKSKKTYAKFKQLLSNKTYKE